jgi:flagellar motility protein MotE (MotC chaperone)
VRVLILVSIFVVSVFAQTIDCTQIFEERKGELLREVEKIDEARQSFEALQAATNTLFDRQQTKLDEQRDDLNATMLKIESKKEEIKSKIEQNEKLLAAIKGATDDKISATYSKMKDSSAAEILEKMSVDEASAILFALEPKRVSKIMEKMEPQKASEVTLRLVLGPPFK